MNPVKASAGWLAWSYKLALVSISLTWKLLLALLSGVVNL